MELRCNVPDVPRFWNDDSQFYVGDRVRVLFANHGKELVGPIMEIRAHSFVVYAMSETVVPYEEVVKIRLAADKEDLNTVPYFDEEEREFWRTHWHTRDGIKEKTPEDIAMLEEFEKTWRNKL